MQEWIINLSEHHTLWVYLFIILTAWLIGPVLSMIFGVLIKLEYFAFTPIYIALMAGELFGDTVWYYIGYYFGHPFVRKFGKYLSITEDQISYVTELFHRYKTRILIISKITNGFGLSFVTLMTAGIAKIPFWKFLSLNLIGQFIWSGALIGIGYFFSDAYLKVDNVLGKISIIALFIVIIFAFVGFGKYLRTKSNYTNI